MVTFISLRPMDEDPFLAFLRRERWLKGLNEDDETVRKYW